MCYTSIWLATQWVYLHNHQHRRKNNELHYKDIIMEAIMSLGNKNCSATLES